MNAPFPKSLTLVERLHLAREVHARALEESKARASEPAQHVEPAPVVAIYEPATADDRRAIDKAEVPSCVCGQKSFLRLCPDCRAWWCSAPGHGPHVCRSAEFAQVSP